LEGEKVSAILFQGDRVIYRVNGRRYRGIVQDVLPMKPQERIPVLKREKTHWIDRKDIRKAPPKREANVSRQESMPGTRSAATEGSESI
jgi:hypothetical protein